MSAKIKSLQKIFPLSLEKDEELRNSDHTDFGCIGIFLHLGEFSWLTTSLMFQSAVSNSAGGNSVVVIRSNPLSKLPAGVHGMSVANPTTLSNVKFKYVNTNSELIDYLSSIHCSTITPYQIIIDSLQDFIPNILTSGNFDDIFAMANLCAAIKDAAAFMTKKRSNGDCFPILVSSVLVPGSLDLEFYHRFFDNVWMMSNFTEEEINGVKITEIPPKTLVNNLSSLHVKVLPSDPIDLLEFCYPTS